MFGKKNRLGWCFRWQWIAWLLLPFCPLAQVTNGVELEDANSGFLSDSLKTHQAQPLLAYRPHLCRNRTGKYGLAGKNHRLIIPCEYEVLPAVLAPLMVAKKQGQFGVITDKNKVIVPFQYKGAQVSADQQRIFCLNTQYRFGVRDAQGREILPEIYAEATDLAGGRFAALHPPSGLFKVFNPLGQVLHEGKYRHIYQKTADTYQVSRLDSLQHETLALLDTAFHFRIPFQYTHIGWVQGDWAWVIDHHHNTRGLFRISKKTFHPLDYFHIGPPDRHGNFLLFSGENVDKRLVGLLDSSLQVVAQPAYRQLDALAHPGWYRAETRRGQCGVLDAQGQWQLEARYYGMEQNWQVTDLQRDEFGQPAYLRDTSLFRVIRSAPGGEMLFGLWHEQHGLLGTPQYQQIEIVDNERFIVTFEDKKYLLHLRGDTLAQGYARMERYGFGQVVAQKSGQNPVLLDARGKELRSIPEFPVAYYHPLHVLPGPAGKALYSRDMQALGTGTYEQLIELHFLPAKALLWYLNHRTVPGYGAWVVAAQKKRDGAYFLIDEKGRELEIK
jgi:hypothetical protein